LFLCGFGVYLNPYLRHYLWEIISNPHVLISDVFYIIIAPFQHNEAWLFTLGFASYLVVDYWMLKNLNNNKNED